MDRKKVYSYSKIPTKSYSNDINKGYILEVDVSYPKHLKEILSDLLFLPETLKIVKYQKLVCNMLDKKNYIVHIGALKLALDYRLILEKVYSVTEFDQKARFKPYIDMNTKLRTRVKNDFGKDFFRLMNNSVFGKTMENVRNHRDTDIKNVTTNKRRN